MANILTPLSIWSAFDKLLDTEAKVLETKESDGVTIEKIEFLGRDTGAGRVRIAAAFAWNTLSPVTETALVLPDSKDTVDEEVLKFFANNGYSALMVDYRGEWDGCEFYTRYPENIKYANVLYCGRHKDFVDDSVAQTSWYEWVIVGLYARKYIKERTKSDDIAVVGFRDGGEIAWKLGVAEKFSCIVPICAAGWHAYYGISKYLREEPKMDDERYRFIAGVDSQSYAQYVKCPVLMLCSTNDKRFDYDRAYDTFSRINPEFVKESLISYSVHTNSYVGLKSCRNLFMFLDKNLKNGDAVIPKPAEIYVETDDKQNLVARAVLDNGEEVADCVMYLAEDCIDSSSREWRICPLKSEDNEKGRQFYLNIYEKTTTIFVFCYVRYANGFTVWSKMVVKKLSGKFRNMFKKNKVLYTNTYGTEGFSFANPENRAVGGLILKDEDILPSLVEKAKGVLGLYSPCGLSTFRVNNPMYAPAPGNILSIDVFCDETANVTLTFKDLNTGEEYSATFNLIGGVWQKILAECKMFKNSSGVSLDNYERETVFTINSPSRFALNNFIWL